MQSQLKLYFPLTPRRPNTLYIRAHSQPTNRIKTTQKIKINLKRLPTDFFTGPSHIHKINNMAKLKLHQQSMSQSYRQSDDDYMSNTVNFSNKPLFRDYKNRQLGSFKRQKMNAVTKQKNAQQQTQSENSNTLNWTFAKNFPDDQRKNSDYKNKTFKIRTQRSRTIETEPQIRDQQDYCKKNNQKWSQEGLQAIQNIISDKIAQVNLNRLRINVRKNNHPQSTLQLIRKQLG